MTRRHFATAAAAAAAARLAAAPPRSQMGLATTCFMSYRRPKDAAEFLEYTHSLGAGGTQSVLPKDPKSFRARLEQLGMWYEAMLPLSTDADAMTRAVRTARETGAVAGRIGALSGRRYETFATMADWKRFVDDARAKIAVAAKVAAAERFPLALENHKDWTLEDALGLMKEFGGEYFGVLLDTGNNISLLDDPYELVEKLAPYALSTHVKDMAWQEHPDGFEMSEMPFGDGLLDMTRILAAIRKARPKTKITLEMITRNPLVVPCLTDKYWLTMPDRPGSALAATLKMVRSRKAVDKLPRLEALDDAARLRSEEENVKACLHVARERHNL